MQGDFQLIQPFFVLVMGGFLVYLLTRFFRFSNKIEAILCILVLSMAFLSFTDLYHQADVNPFLRFGAFGNGGVSFQVNIYGVFISQISVFVAIMVVATSAEILKYDRRYLLYYPLILLLLVGLLGMFFSEDLFNIFLLAELTTITASALIGFRFKKEGSVRAGYKYLIMSGIATMIMLLGIYFIYWSSSDLSVSGALRINNSMTRLGAGCFLLGFSLKAGVVPLHTWVPDVYSKAPGPVSALLAAVVSKSTLFIGPRIVLSLGVTTSELGIYLLILSMANILLGSVRALNQASLRRFLAFSSIAQTGYLMFALGIGFYYNLEAGFTASLFLFFIIAMMKALAFLSASTYEFYYETGMMDMLKGVGKICPSIAFCFTVSLAGLAGIPLLAGFTGKWLTLSAALLAGEPFALACLVVFLTGTLIGLGAYLPTIVRQYLSEGDTELTQYIALRKCTPSLWVMIPTYTITLLIFVLGIFPGSWIAEIEAIATWMMP